MSDLILLILVVCTLFFLIGSRFESKDVERQLAQQIGCRIEDNRHLICPTPTVEVAP